MIAKDLFQKINNIIPENLALKEDTVGYMGNNNLLNFEINSIKITMDHFLKEDKNLKKDELIITHHPPLFNPKSHTYVIHSNWDIINGGANDALADELNIKVIDTFHKKTGIGRICTSEINFKELLNNIKKNIVPKNSNIKIVNKPDENKKIEKIVVISGFGLSKLEYIQLAKDLNIDMIISGDLTQSGAILAKNLGVCIIDIGHHNSEIPGLKYLKEKLSPIGLPISLNIGREPWENLK